MALDESKEGDVTTEIDDFIFTMEEYLTENFSAFTIDYSDNWLRKGFTVIPDKKVSSC